MSRCCEPLRTARMAKVAPPPAGIRRETGSADHMPSPARDLLRSPGRPLDTSTRSSMESAFGYDFGRVRVHTDGRAAGAADNVDARAFTYGQNVAFAAGEYSPHSAAGSRLLAHELAHVVQQGTGAVSPRVQRQPRKSPQAQLNRRMKEHAELRHFDFGAYWIKQPPVNKKYLKHKTKVDQLLSTARKSQFRLVYLEAIRTALRTPERLRAAPFQAKQTKRLQSSAKAATRPLSTLSGYFASFSEEFESSGSPRGRWKKLKGFGGKYYRVDRRDLRNIVVRVRVFLTGPNNQHVKLVESMEDAIEKSSAGTGYTLDLDFVGASQKNKDDVFTVEVDTGKWPTSGNWVGNVKTLAHELHHLLDLPDRYDYLVHKKNLYMPMASRLHWIGEQIDTDTKRKSRVDPLEKKSFMGGSKGGTKLTDEDICLVAKMPMAQCLQVRRQLGQQTTKPSGGPPGATSKPQPLKSQANPGQRTPTLTIPNRREDQ